ncbi:hypothetical protein ANN_06874 [Periplaneta americana]|uniref:Uncharacterized protein n=1 Tax=Periplaneta americana TaxID=6978 RepID=A0ABQ8TET8_PERAM|nr:hypothetical protein ANN_06874 [Periplaneta americana]
MAGLCEGSNEPQGSLKTICKWGPNGVTEYKDNMMKLMRSFKTSLPPETLVIWTTTPPVSASCHGALLIKQVEFLHHTLRFEVMEANMFSRQVLVAHGYDVVDIHHHLRMQLHRRAGDGIHWLPAPVRHMTNLLLTHIVTGCLDGKEAALTRPPSVAAVFQPGLCYGCLLFGRAYTQPLLREQEAKLRPFSLQASSPPPTRTLPLITLISHHPDFDSQLLSRLVRLNTTISSSPL